MTNAYGQFSPTQKCTTISGQQRLKALHYADISTIDENVYDVIKSL